MASLSHAFGRGGFVSVKIERRNEPTGEQLAASIILTGASALRMMRAERRQMGYISSVSYTHLTLPTKLEV